MNGNLSGVRSLFAFLTKNSGTEQECRNLCLGMKRRDLHEVVNQDSGSIELKANCVLSSVHFALIYREN